MTSAPGAAILDGCLRFDWLAPVRVTLGLCRNRLSLHGAGAHDSGTMIGRVQDGPRRPPKAVIRCDWRRIRQMQAAADSAAVRLRAVAGEDKPQVAASR